jgi:hypothetical protein
VFNVDLHFYASYIGTETARGDRTQKQVVEGLAACTSLNLSQAAGYVKAFKSAGKIKIKRGKLVQTTPW